jgi:hypothetical protein
MIEARDLEADRDRERGDRQDRDEPFAREPAGQESDQQDHEPTSCEGHDRSQRGPVYRRSLQMVDGG